VWRLTGTASPESGKGAAEATPLHPCHAKPDPARPHRAMPCHAVPRGTRPHLGADGDGVASVDQADVVGISQGRHADQALGVWRQEAVASFYGGYFHGRRAADGSRFDQMGSTAAHRFFPFGTKIRVINPRTKKAEVVTVTDRGPYVRGRTIDLSLGTARRLGIERQGVAPVTLEVLS
jgi:rare lipoprotein A (peptidoglycan hydrolase)